MRTIAAVLYEAGLPRPYSDSKPLKIEEVELDGPETAQSANPFACSTLGILASIGVTWLASRFTSPLPAEHLDRIFASSVAEELPVAASTASDEPI